MTAIAPYILFPGTARDALEFYAGVFGGDVQAYTFAEFGRDDGDPGRIAHGELRGAVALFAADTGGTEQPFTAHGLFFALLGAADRSTSHAWFDALAADGEVLDPLQERPWGDHDGQVKDQFGLTWLIGFTPRAG
ncbi:VOC family protein [Microbacterium sp. 1P10UB]|uniref:VOC family protein n=1 Tax=unclassified Microbacterium TaxID=2609290 RepID=UPI0039A28D60